MFASPGTMGQRWLKGQLNQFKSTDLCKSNSKATTDRGSLPLLISHRQKTRSKSRSIGAPWRFLETSRLPVGCGSKIPGTLKTLFVKGKMKRFRREAAGSKASKEGC